MNIKLIRVCFLALGAVLLSSACSVAKLEARLEANPQCKDIVNPKTGALMPCPGSEKAFYREVGLAPAKPAPAANSPAVVAVPAGSTATAPASSSTSTTSPAAPTKSTQTPVDCKPQIHKKTGGTLPCPAPD
ncbi:hypothetical protein [Polynucleobacter sp. UB-Tiil-W10]|uniref:hypothetical protein n=1 Tax=Polynucleobacter sp. UB-Tiil-W10 TaxID=1855648 RepID=UPI001C0AE733|nr:hypothetical protein [Polynucleobacter sp. UB-Tiil-W10]MBU3541513.1 hypothetical protein [Polynucleobacter sp. UB-Tiil-W10]